MKGYLAPWSNRRETVGLMGTFLVFLLGLPGHTEPMIESAKRMVTQVVRLILVFLGLAHPVAQQPAAIVTAAHPARPAIVHKHARPAKVQEVDPNSMQLRTEPLLYHFTYIFEGKANLKGAPCPNASVLARLTSDDRTVVKGAVTEADGSYRLEVTIDAQDKAPVDWELKAYTPDFKPVELAGRKIVQRGANDSDKEPVQAELDKSPIIVINPVEFVVSSTK